jgi:hypothetical protein
MSLAPPVPHDNPLLDQDVRIGCVFAPSRGEIVITFAEARSDCG